MRSSGAFQNAAVIKRIAEPGARFKRFSFDGGGLIRLVTVPAGPLALGAEWGFDNAEKVFLSRGIQLKLAEQLGFLSY